jgi:D-alanyl-D-alanine carboxypeptidase/D-alanyl-D-alanine-endopeptidase (penicillin-binding protein 4)
MLFACLRPAATLRLRAATAAVAASAFVAPWAIGAQASADGLPASVALALDQAKLPRTAVVAMVQEVGSTGTRLAWQPDRPVNPASLMKLMTTYASLELLGPAWAWHTPVWLQGTVRETAQGGVLDGNLVIKGSGDPKLVAERMWQVLRRVQQLGVREIHGDIVLDRSAFVVPEQNAADFDGEALRPYNVGPDALMLNFKSTVFTFTPDPARGVALVSTDLPLAGVRVDTTVPLTLGPCDDWRTALRADFSDPLRQRFSGGFALACGEKVWPVAYADAARYNERAIAGLWQEMGGRLTGSVHDGPAPAMPPSFETVSPPLSEVIRDINKFSNNMMAQQLFLSLALAQRGSGTPELARQVLRDWARDRLGAPSPATLVIDNGSGLSRDGRISAALLARLLQLASSGPLMPELLASLPLGGIDGTLKRSRATAGRAHLKTGSLRDVAGIAGVVLGDSGRRYVVVAIVNHPNAKSAAAVFDALVQWTLSDTAAAASTAEGRR